jgi:hypothetical protein
MTYITRFALMWLKVNFSFTQRESPISILRTTLKTKGITGLYSGCTALIVGNSVKAGVRFVSYDKFKGILADSEVHLRSHSPTRPALTCPQGKVSAPRSLVGQKVFWKPLNPPLSHHNSHSWARSWDDGSDLRRHAIRNNQVRLSALPPEPEAENSFTGRS